MNDSYPLISVLIPVYNCREVIRCLDSIRCQTYPNLKIIVINDCSTDDTLFLLNSYIKQYQQMNIELFSNEENCGLAITRNRLIELSQGKGFIFIDSDDEFYNSNSIMNLYKASNNIENDITMGKTKFVGTLKKNGISPITKLWVNRRLCLKYTDWNKLCPKIDGCWWWNILMKKSFIEKYKDIRLWNRKQTLDEEHVLNVLISLAKTFRYVNNYTHKYHYSKLSSCYIKHLTVEKLTLGIEYMKYATEFYVKYSDQMSEKTKETYKKNLWHWNAFLWWRLFNARKQIDRKSRNNIRKQYQEVIVKISPVPIHFKYWWHFWFALPSKIFKVH